MSVNKALILVAHGAGFALTAECEDEAISRCLDDVGANTSDGFDLWLAGVDHARWDSDGLWVGDLTLEDNGPGDWEGAREVIVALAGPRRATAEEWASFRAGEWIWLDGPRISPDGEA